MALSNRFSHGFLAAFLLIALPIASFAAQKTPSNLGARSCRTDLPETHGASCDRKDYASYPTHNEYVSAACGLVDVSSYDSPTCIDKTENNTRRVYVAACLSDSNSPWFLTSSGELCTTEPPPDQQCSIPEGTEKGISTDVKASVVCDSNCEFVRNSGSTCLFSGSNTSCWARFRSNGDFCEFTDPQQDRPFHDFTDEDDCYRSTSGNKFCEVPPDSPCPNYTVIDGRKYCKESSEQPEPDDSDGDGIPDTDDPDPSNPDSDGDGAPDGDDPDPSNPDFDGDGIPDGDDPDRDGDGAPDSPGSGSGNGGGGGAGLDPDPNNPDTDGDGIPDGQDTDADGNGVEDDQEPEEEEGNTVGKGTCDKEQVEEPDCSSADPIQCAVLLNEWHHFCQEQLFREELKGTEEYNQGGESLTDGDAPENQIGSREVGFDSFLSGLDDSGSGFGGSNSCPADIQVSVPPFGSIAIPFTFICDFASRIRPLVIALGWIAAGFIAFRSMTEK